MPPKRVEPEGARRAPARSLFGEILDWMFAPLLLLWPMSVSLTYLVAQSIASSPFDHSLIERGEALAAHVRFADGHARFDLSPGLREIFGNGASDAGSYLVALNGGPVLAGDIDLPRAAPALPAEGGETAARTFQLRDDTLRGHPVRVAFAWATPPGGREAAAPAVLIEVAEPPAERTALANEIIKGVILPQFVVLPLALVLVWFGLTRGLAPLSRLQQTIRERSPDDLSPIQATSAPEELAPLLGAFNDLLQRMTHNLEVQKRFISDAAHQMKTPLAGLRTQAELARREGNANELQRSLQQIADSTDRATRLVNQLLALARAEHGAGESGAASAVDLDELARAVVRDWVDRAAQHGVDLGYEGPLATAGAVDCTVRGVPTLLRELLNNLIDNALRYSAAGETPAGVTVRVAAGAGRVRLEVEDDGPGIPPQERERVFERFYRVLGNKKDGSGLGLAIVRQIAQHHRAEVSLADAHPANPQPGCLFRIEFAAVRAR